MLKVCTIYLTPTITSNHKTSQTCGRKPYICFSLQNFEKTILKVWQVTLPGFSNFILKDVISLIISTDAVALFT